MVQIVIDTNVLVAAMRSRHGRSNELLRRLSDPRWQVNISATLLLEYEEVLGREAARGNFPTEVPTILVDRFCAIARHHAIFFRWRPQLSDPDDEFLVDLAIRCQCDYIITFDRRHLAPAEFFGIRVVTPAIFLEIMGA